jgi:hypothetical protein
VYLPLFGVEAPRAGDNVPGIVLTGSARPTNGIEKKAWIRGWREGAVWQCASGVPITERSEPRGETGAPAERVVAVPMEGALSPYTERSELRGRLRRLCRWRGR